METEYIYDVSDPATYAAGPLDDPNRAFGFGTVEGAMNAKVYRIGVFVPVLGIGGLLFFAYIALYWSGVIAWKISPRMKELSFEDDPGLVCIAVLLCAGCLLLVWTVRLKVTLDETEISYRGVMRSVRMRWADITRVNNHLRGGSIHLWANQRHLQIPTMFFPQSDLWVTIGERVKQNSPDAVIDESPVQSWPQKRKGCPTPRDEEA